MFFDLKSPLVIGSGFGFLRRILPPKVGSLISSLRDPGLIAKGFFLFV
jgi:hypothetical protein